MTDGAAVDLGIIGLAKSGKTTVFNVLTRGQAHTAAFGRTGLEPNVGVVKVPDPRLDQLAALTAPKKVTPAEVRYLDMGGSANDFGKGEGFAGPLLNALGKVDALIHVVRSFADPSLPHPHGDVDPARDIGALNLELAFSDAAIIERRLERLTVGLKASRPAEREAAAREQEMLRGVKRQLDADVPVREMGLTEDQRVGLVTYSLLTAKPLLILLNIGEEQIAEAEDLEAHYRSQFQRPQMEVLAFCGKLEVELALMDSQEAPEFRAVMGLKEPGVERVIQTSYSLVGLISFFTIGDDENRAWMVRQGTPAPQAAGKIHSDMERGFIRSEVVSWQLLLETGGWSEARKRGHLRVEGKNYQVQDGDIMNILFSR